MTTESRDSNSTRQRRANEQLGQQPAQSIPNAKPCPCCAGDVYPNEERCKNCASPLASTEVAACKPSEKESFEKASANEPVEDEERIAVQKKSKPVESRGCLAAILMISCVSIAFIISKCDLSSSLKFILNFILKFILELLRIIAH